MVIIVPTFTERDEGENPRITGIILGIEAAFAPDVRHGINAGRTVEEGSGRDEEAPHQHLPARGSYAVGG